MIKKDYGTQTGFNGKERYIEIRPNGAGVLVGLETYTKINKTANYTTNMKRMVPDMSVRDDITSVPVTDSTGATIAHTLTFGTGIVVTKDMKDNPTEYSLVLYNKQAIADAKLSGEFADLSAPKYCAVLEIDDPATVFTTVGATVNTIKTTGVTEYIANMTACVVMANNAYMEIAQATDYNYDESRDEIDISNWHSGGKASLDGDASLTISGITGIYCPMFPTVATLDSAFNGNNPIECRHGALRAQYASYVTGSYKVAEFTTSGTMDGSDKITYQASLNAQSGTTEKKTIV